MFALKSEAVFVWVAEVRHATAATVKRMQDLLILIWLIVFVTNVNKI